METRELICIQCPLGCPITVTLEEGQVVDVKGNTCKRGELYAKKEVTAPTRVVTSTVKVLGGQRPVVAVKTERDIPKEKIFACMEEINQAQVTAPVAIGDVILEDLCGTGVRLVAAASLEAAQP